MFYTNILGSSTVLDEAKPELVKVWADFTENMEPIAKVIVGKLNRAGCYVDFATVTEIYH